MKIAVISDPHASCVNTERVLEDIAREDPDRLFCLGDLVGYGHNPEVVVPLIRRTADLCLQGNHDAAAVGQFDEFREALRYDPRGRGLLEAEQVLDDEDFEWLATRRPAAHAEGIDLFHGRRDDPLMGFMSLPGAMEQARAQLQAQPGPLSLVGHTHMPLAIRLRGEEISWSEPGQGPLDLSSGESWILNPGSCGLRQNRSARDRRPAWLMLDLDGGLARWHRL